MKKIILVTTLILSAFMTGCTPNKTDSVLTSVLLGVQYDDSLGWDDREPSFKGTESFGKWSVNSSQDDIQDYWVVSARLPASNKSDATLFVRCQGGQKTVVTIHWDVILRGDEYGADVEHRIDKNTPETGLWLVLGGLENVTSLGYSSKPLAQKLLEGKKFVARADGHTRQSTLRFDLTGVKDALAPVREFCAW